MLKKLKRILPVLLAIALVFASVPQIDFSVLAATGNEKGFSYKTEYRYIYNEDGTSTYVSGAYITACDSPVGDVVIPETIGGYDVIGIYDRAFQNCTELTGISFPDSLLVIEIYAFSGCSALAAVDFPESIKEINVCAFEKCTSLTQVEIPDNVRVWSRVFQECTSIKTAIINSMSADSDYILADCTSLESVTLASDITVIPAEAFYKCSGLTSVVLHEGITEIENYAFDSSGLTEIILPNSLKKIGLGAFRFLSNVTSVTIPENVEHIDSSVFMGCYSLAEIEFLCKPTVFGSDIFLYTAWFNNQLDGAVYIDDILYCYKGTADSGFKIAEGTRIIAGDALKSQYSIEALDVPEGVEFVGDYAFSNMRITSITIPKSVKNIGYRLLSDCRQLVSAEILCDIDVLPGRIFDGCEALTNITLAEGMTTIDSYAFYGCKSLAEITVPNSVVSIENSAFEGCTSLVNISLPENLTYIGSYAFRGCSRLKAIDIPEGVMRIDSYAFNNCTELSSVKLPNSLSDIGSNAFGSCYALNNVIIPNKVYSISSDAFLNCTSLTEINLPKSLYCLYDAFDGCTALNTLRVYATQFNYISGTPFSGCPIENVYVYCTEEQYNSYSSSLGIPDSAAITYYASGSCGSDAMWVFDKNSGVLTISGSGGITSFALNNNGIKVNSVIIEEGITSIGSGVFAGGAYSQTTSFSLPKSLKTIGFNSFVGCVALKSIAIPDSVTSIEAEAFKGLALTSVTLPDSLNSIGNKAFEGCEQLTEIVIPEGTQVIGNRAFADCTALSSITVPPSVDTIGTEVFDNTAWYNSMENGIIYIGSAAYAYKGEAPTEVVIKEGTTSISNGCFKSKTTLNSVVIPEGVTSIGAYAFEHCTALNSIDLPDSVVNIGDHAFNWCSSLENVKLSKSLEVIGNAVFGRCQALKSIVIPEGVTEIGSDAFAGCSSLSVIELPSSLALIGSGAFGGCGLNEISLPDTQLFVERFAFESTEIMAIHIPAQVELEISALAYMPNLTEITVDEANPYYTVVDNMLLVEDGTGLFAYPGGGYSEYVTLPEGVISIYPDAFCGANINTVDLTGIVAIGEYAFTGSMIKTVTIPESLEYWEDGIFSYCPELTEVTMPESLDNLDGCNFLPSYLFDGCESLQSISIPGGIYEILDCVFFGCTALTDIVIPSSVEYIGCGAFESSGIGNVEIQNETALIDEPEECAYGVIEQPIGLQYIDEGAFAGCANLKEIVLPDSVYHIGAYAFEGSGLEKIDLGRNVTDIREYAFSSLESLKAVICRFEYIETYSYNEDYSIEMLHPEAFEGSNTDAKFIFYMWSSFVYSFEDMGFDIMNFMAFGDFNSNGMDSFDLVMLYKELLGFEGTLIYPEEYENQYGATGDWYYYFEDYYYAMYPSQWPDDPVELPDVGDGVEYNPWDYIDAPLPWTDMPMENDPDPELREYLCEAVKDVNRDGRFDIRDLVSLKNLGGNAPC